MEDRQGRAGRDQDDRCAGSSNDQSRQASRNRVGPNSGPRAYQPPDPRPARGTPRQIETLFPHRLAQRLGRSLVGTHRTCGQLVAGTGESERDPRPVKATSHSTPNSLIRGVSILSGSAVNSRLGSVSSLTLNSRLGSVSSLTLSSTARKS